LNSTVIVQAQVINNVQIIQNGDNPEMINITIDINSWYRVRRLQSESAWDCRHLNWTSL